MRYRMLGKTGLYVSELCLGTMTFGGKGFWEVIGRLTAPEAEEIIGMALDAGVNFIDTADVYSEGESERHVGAAIARWGGRVIKSLSQQRCAAVPVLARTRSVFRASISWIQSTPASVG
jgi:predicted aldo/keto reductase-like oxidoreductase